MMKREAVLYSDLDFLRVESEEKKLDKLDIERKIEREKNKKNPLKEEMFLI